MDTPELPDFTQLTHTTTLKLAEAVLMQYQVNERWMKAIISVMKMRLEPPAQSFLVKSSLVVFSQGAVPACSACALCGHSHELFFSCKGGKSSASKQHQLNMDMGNFCVTDNNTPSQPTQGTPPRQCIMRQATMCQSPSASPPATQSESDLGWGKTHSIH